MASHVLEFARRKGLGGDMDDAQLTLFLGQTHPEFLQSNPEFAQQYAALQAPEVSPGAMSSLLQQGEVDPNYARFSAEVDEANRQEAERARAEALTEQYETARNAAMRMQTDLHQASQEGLGEGLARLGVVAGSGLESGVTEMIPRQVGGLMRLAGHVIDKDTGNILTTGLLRRGLSKLGVGEVLERGGRALTDFAETRTDQWGNKVRELDLKPEDRGELAYRLRGMEATGPERLVANLAENVPPMVLTALLPGAGSALGAAPGLVTTIGAAVEGAQIAGDVFASYIDQPGVNPDAAARAAIAAGVGGAVVGKVFAKLGLGVNARLADVTQEEAGPAIYGALRETLGETGEEGWQQVVQDISERIELDPNRPLDQSIREVIASGLAGGTLGLGAHFTRKLTGPLADHLTRKSRQRAELNDALNQELEGFGTGPVDLNAAMPAMARVLSLDQTPMRPPSPGGVQIGSQEAVDMAFAAGEAAKVKAGQAQQTADMARALEEANRKAAEAAKTAAELTGQPVPVSDAPSTGSPEAIQYVEWTQQLLQQAEAAAQTARELAAIGTGGPSTEAAGNAAASRITPSPVSAEPVAASSPVAGVGVPLETTAPSAPNIVPPPLPRAPYAGRFDEPSTPGIMPFGQPLPQAEPAPAPLPRPPWIGRPDLPSTPERSPFGTPLPPPAPVVSPEPAVVSPAPAPVTPSPPGQTAAEIPPQPVTPNELPTPTPAPAPAPRAQAPTQPRAPAQAAPPTGEAAPVTQSLGQQLGIDYGTEGRDALQLTIYLNKMVADAAALRSVRNLTPDRQAQLAELDDAIVSFKDQIAKIPPARRYKGEPAILVSDLFEARGSEGKGALLLTEGARDLNETRTSTKRVLLLENPDGDFVPAPVYETKGTVFIRMPGQAKGQRLSEVMAKSPNLLDGAVLIRLQRPVAGAMTLPGGAQSIPRDLILDPSDGLLAEVDREATRAAPNLTEEEKAANQNKPKTVEATERQMAILDELQAVQEGLMEADEPVAVLREGGGDEGSLDPETLAAITKAVGPRVNEWVDEQLASGAELEDLTALDWLQDNQEFVAEFAQKYGKQFDYPPALIGRHLFDEAQALLGDRINVRPGPAEGWRGTPPQPGRSRGSLVARAAPVEGQTSPLMTDAGQPSSITRNANQAPPQSYQIDPKKVRAAFNSRLAAGAAESGELPLPERSAQANSDSGAGRNLQAAIEVGRRGVRSIRPAGRAPSGAAANAAAAKVLKQWAQEQGLLIPEREFTAAWEKDGRKGESEHQVYFDPANGLWWKRNLLNFHDGSIISYLERLAAHKLVFPEAEAVFRGFTTYKGELMPVVSQADMQGEAPSDETIRQKILDLGFVEVFETGKGMSAAHRLAVQAGLKPPPLEKPKRVGFYLPGEGIWLEDLHGENAVLSPEGRLLAFDPVMYYVGDLPLQPLPPVPGGLTSPAAPAPGSASPASAVLNPDGTIEVQRTPAFDALTPEQQARVLDEENKHAALWTFLVEQMKAEGFEGDFAIGARKRLEEVWSSLPAALQAEIEAGVAQVYGSDPGPAQRVAEAVRIAQQKTQGATEAETRKTLGDKFLRFLKAFTNWLANKFQGGKMPPALQELYDGANEVLARAGDGRPLDEYTRPMVVDNATEKTLHEFSVPALTNEQVAELGPEDVPPFMATPVNQPSVQVGTQVATDARFGSAALPDVIRWTENARRYLDEFDQLLHAQQSGLGPGPMAFGYDYPTYNGLKQALKRDVPVLLDRTLADRRTQRRPFAMTGISIPFLQNLEDAVRRTSGIFGRPAQQAMARLRNAHLEARALHDKTHYWGGDLQKMRAEAVASHPTLDGDQMLYRERVLNPMGHEGRQFGSPLRAGFTLRSGENVTAQDMAYLRRVSEYNRELLQVAQRYPGEQTLEKVGRRNLSRQAGSVGDYNATRHVNVEGEGLVEELFALNSNENEALLDNPNWAANSPNRFAQLWNHLAAGPLDALRVLVLDSDRNDLAWSMAPRYQTALQDWADDIRNGGFQERIPDLDTFVDGLMSRVPGATREQARDAVGGLLDQMGGAATARRNERAAEATSLAYMRALDRDSEFTRPANTLQFPSSFYDYSQLTDADVLGQSKRAEAPALIQVVTRLQQVEAELRTKREDLDPKRGGRTLTPEQQRELTDSTNLENVLKGLNEQLLLPPSFDDGAAGALARLARILPGALLTRPTVAIRNFLGGQAALTMTGSALERGGMTASALRRTSELPSLTVRSALQLARRVAPRHASRWFQQARRLGILPQVLDYVSALNQELANVERLGLSQPGSIGQRIGARQDTVALQPNQKDRRSPFSMQTGRVLTGVQSVSDAAAGVTGLLPDAPLNAQAAALVPRLESRLAPAAAAYRARMGAAPLPATDPQSALQPGEGGLSADVIGVLRDDLGTGAGLNLEEVLLRGDGTPGQDLLTQEERDSMARYYATAANAGTPFNRPQQAQHNRFARSMTVLGGYVMARSQALGEALRSVPKSKSRHAAAVVGGIVSSLIGAGLFGLLGEELVEDYNRTIGFTSGRPAPHEKEFWSADAGLMDRLVAPIGMNYGLVGDLALQFAQVRSQNRGFDLSEKFLPLNFTRDIIQSLARMATYQGEDKLRPLRDLGLRYGPMVNEVASMFDLNLRREWNDGVRSMANAYVAAGIQNTSKQAFNPDSYNAATPMRQGIREAGMRLHDAQAKGDKPAEAKAMAELVNARDRLVKYYEDKGQTTAEAKTAARRDYMNMDPARVALGKEPTDVELAQALPKLTGARREAYDRTVSAWQAMASQFPDKSGNAEVPQPGRSTSRSSRGAQRSQGGAAAAGSAGSVSAGGIQVPASAGGAPIRASVVSASLPTGSIARSAGRAAGRAAGRTAGRVRLRRSGRRPSVRSVRLRRGRRGRRRGVRLRRH